MKIILDKQANYWSAWFYGVGQMPEDYEIPLPYADSATLAMVAIHMRKRFPGATLFYRTQLGTLTHVAC
jgi:hypothetical protein